jgi:hypothetical protein
MGMLNTREVAVSAERRREKGLDGSGDAQWMSTVTNLCKKSRSKYGKMLISC